MERSACEREEEETKTHDERSDDDIRYSKLLSLSKLFPNVRLELPNRVEDRLEVPFGRSEVSVPSFSDESVVLEREEGSFRSENGIGVYEMQEPSALNFSETL